MFQSSDFENILIPMSYWPVVSAKADCLLTFWPNDLWTLISVWVYDMSYAYIILSATFNNAVCIDCYYLCYYYDHFLKRHLIWLYVLYNNPYLYKFVSFFKQNFAAQYDGSKGPDPGPGPMVSAKSSTWKSQNNEP